MAAGARGNQMNGGDGSSSGRNSIRLIPKRGQVKVGIVMGLAHSVASIFSPSAGNRAAAAR